MRKHDYGNDLMNEIDSAMTNPIGYMSDNVQSVFEEADKLCKAKRKFNRYVDAYIRYAQLEMEKRQEEVKREFGTCPKLKSLNLATLIEKTHNDDEFVGFKTTSDFVAYLRSQSAWSDVSLVNKMALRILSRDEKILEKFINKQREKHLNV